MINPLHRFFKRHKRFSRIRSWSRTRKIIAVSTASFGLFLVASLAVLHLYPAVAANVADSVLRPIIGAQATVQLESFFFSINDNLNQLLYGVGAKPSADIFTKTATVTERRPKARGIVNSFDLSPINFHPGTYPKLPGEGIWSVIVQPQFHGKIDMARTFVVPDPERAYAVTSLVKLNMHDLRMRAIAGTEQPGGPVGKAGPGMIPTKDQASQTLVAAFNGGFQYKDGRYGMTVEQKTYLPLQKGLATLIIRQNNTVAIEPYSGNPVDVAQTVATRQNGPMIVQNSQVTTATYGGGMARWGLTVTNSMYTWRSGIGLTKNGDLIYAVGPSLNINTLAEALKAGGAVSGMQLDINPYWVRFVTYTPSVSGKYSYESLLKKMQNGGDAYLHGYNKDFFYVLAS